MRQEKKLLRCWRTIPSVLYLFQVENLSKSNQRSRAYFLLVDLLPKTWKKCQLQVKYKIKQKNNTLGSFQNYFR